MADCTTIFDALEGFLPLKLLEKAINETGADRATKKFTVLRQLNTMMYAQLTQEDCLRSITDSIASDKKLQKYTGTISYSQLSRKNSQRSPEVFKMIFGAISTKLIRHQAVNTVPGSWGTFKILDATLIHVCLSLFPWAYYRETKAAVKMHTLLDFGQNCPESVVVTDGITHDKSVMESFDLTPGFTYLFDRGYLKYKEFDRYCNDGIFFVTRLLKNAVMEIHCENTVPQGSPVISDKEVVLGTFYTKMKNPVRVIEVIDSGTGEPFSIVTNRFDLTAEEIAEIYRLRWKIELFFKWIKQHLKIKKFFGRSPNAVENQLYSALILYILLKLMHHLVGTKYDFLKLVRHISTNPWNTINGLIESLTNTKPPGQKRRRFNWKREYSSLLALYMVSEQY